MKDSLIGKPAPPITLESVNGEYTLPIGKKPIAIFFYPQANTYGCTREACSFRDAQKANDVFLRHPELEVVGVSKDEVSKQASFASSNSLPFPLLADTAGVAQKAYGVGKALMGLAPERKTIFIGPDGIVRDVYVANIDFKSHVNFVEQELKKLEAEAPAPASVAPTATASAAPDAAA